MPAESRPNMFPDVVSNNEHTEHSSPEHVSQGFIRPNSEPSWDNPNIGIISLFTATTIPMKINDMAYITITYWLNVADFSFSVSINTSCESATESIVETTSPPD